MGAAASVVDPGEKQRALLEALLKLKPELEGKSEEEMFAAVREDIGTASKARQIMPAGFALAEEEFGNAEGSLKGLVSKIGHICRVVKDAEVSRKFYQNLVGAKLLNRPKFPTNGFWLWLGNVQLHLIQSDLSVPPDHPDGGTKVNHFSFDVYDFEDCERRLKAAGVEYKKVYVPEGDRGINQIFFQDPDLHWIELCDCHKMGDFIFGDFDEVRATEISKFYSEGVDLAAPFIATCVLLLMGSRYTHKPGAGNPSRLFEIFQTYAGDDNKISQAELGRMLARMGYSACESSLQSLLAQIDVDHDLSISFNEFVRFVRKVVVQTPNDELAAEIFKVIDSNSTGSVTTAEFRRVMEGLGVELTDAQAAETFKMCDSDGSGGIGSKECVDLMAQFRKQLMI